jgi:cytochrome c oxidase subunit 2
MQPFDEWLRKLLLLPPAASSMARPIDRLHFSVISVTMLGATLLVLVGGYYCVRYRRRRPRDANETRPLAPTPPLWAELGLVGFLFTLFVAWWAVGFKQYVELAQAPEDALDVYVTAKQWMWKFSYPDGSHTIDELFVPVGRPVRLILTSRDVIHSLYVPSFRLKQDAVPGRYTSLWFTATVPGRQPIYCAEYCGTDHSRMSGSVVVLSAEDYSRWLAQPDARRAGEGNTARDADLRSEGERVAARHGCLRCHTVDGSPHLGPSFAGLYGADIPLANAEHVTADVAYLTESMMDPAVKVHAGFEPVMPSYAGYLNPPEVSALVEFIKSLKDVPGRSAREHGIPSASAAALTPPAGSIGRPPGEPLALPSEPGHASEQGLPAPGRELMPLPRAPRERLEQELGDGGAP